MAKVSNILFVHGAWANSSAWEKVLPLINAASLTGTAVSLSLTSLADDVATVKRAIALIDGPLLLVGHSYGGVVITEAGSDPKVAGLVYVAAFAPDRIFIIDGSIWTSAGMTACIDLALEMVEKDYGADLVRSVAQKLVVHHRRGGGQSQHSELLNMDAKSDRIQTALEYARRNLKSQLSVQELADAACLSLRQFSRAFRAETGQSPAKAVANLRLEAARLLIEQSRHPVDVVATETGFADSERMRRAFVRAFGHPPQVIRNNARAEFSAA